MTARDQNMLADTEGGAAPAPDGVPNAADGAAPATTPSATRRWFAREALYRRALFVAGSLFLLLGAIGMLVPMLPGTVFLILAAWCFARSSPRFEAWLLAHRYLGPSVARWKATGAIPPVAKALAMSSFVGTLAGAWYFGAPRIMLILLATLFAALALFMLTRPNS